MNLILLNSYSESIEFIYKKEEMQIDIKFDMDKISLKNCY